jgi:catechol 2,3-dioxygenase
MTDTLAAKPAAAAAPKVLVPNGTHLGPVHLAVTEAERALSVWRDMVGLTVLSQTPSEIVLGPAGADAPLIVLHPGAKRAVVPNTSGLYHVAIHVPSRHDLAVVVARLFQNRFRNAPTDHLVTETTYLWDHDGNGIEITFETPWRGTFAGDDSGYYGITPDGKRHSGREPVDLESLFGELKEGENLNVPLPKGTRIGHVHLHVADLKHAMDFYSGAVGFGWQMLSRQIRMADVALDYPPHILAFNTWAGEGAPQPPPDSAGLRFFTIALPSEAARDEMRRRIEATGAKMSEIDVALETRDPAGNRLRLVVG